jgi:hypothetical protein
MGFGFWWDGGVLWGLTGPALFLLSREMVLIVHGFPSAVAALRVRKVTGWRRGRRDWGSRPGLGGRLFQTTLTQRCSPRAVRMGLAAPASIAPPGSRGAAPAQRGRLRLPPARAGAHAARAALGAPPAHTALAAPGLPPGSVSPATAPRAAGLRAAAAPDLRSKVPHWTCG